MAEDATNDRKGKHMGRYELPLLFPEEFNDNAAKLLCAAEEIIIEECCANGCKHLPDGGFMGNRAARPSMCRFMQVSGTAPLECAAYESEADR